jgi:hypothetical protein
MAASTERLDIPAQPGPSVCGGRIVVAIARHPGLAIATVLARGRDARMAGAKHAGAEQIYYSNGSEHDHTGEGTCPTHYDRRRTLQSSLLVLAPRRDAIYLYYLLSGLADAIEVAIIRQFGRYPPSAVDDQAIRLRATHQLVEVRALKRMKHAGPPLAIVPSCPAWMIA